MPTALTFSICQVCLGLDISHVREILPCVKLVHPPEMPYILRGFVNVEQELIPVLRLEGLLQLDLEDSHWNPERNLGSRILVANLDGLAVAWMVDEGVEMLRYKVAETVKLPGNHILNNCADHVIPRPPPEMSIVLLQAKKLLFESERVRVAQLLRREKQRLDMVGEEAIVPA